MTSLSKFCVQFQRIFCISCWRHCKFDARLDLTGAPFIFIDSRVETSLVHTSLDNMAMFGMNLVIFVVIFCIIFPHMSNGRHLVKRDNEDEKLESK